MPLTAVLIVLCMDANHSCRCPQQAVLLGGLSFFMAWVVQAFFAAVLLVRPAPMAMCDKAASCRRKPTSAPHASGRLVRLLSQYIP